MGGWDGGWGGGVVDKKKTVLYKMATLGVWSSFVFREPIIGRIAISRILTSKTMDLSETTMTSSVLKTRSRHVKSSKERYLLG